MTAVSIAVQSVNNLVRRANEPRKEQRIKHKGSRIGSLEVKSKSVEYREI
jgi:hypothetical protein